MVAAVATPVIDTAMSPEPDAASAAARDISVVVAVCSSTAAEIEIWYSLIDPMISLIHPIDATAPEVSSWIASTLRAMSSVARAVSCASSLTSLATTAKPLPASPARAASIVALSARRFVCSAIAVIARSLVQVQSRERHDGPWPAETLRGPGAVLVR